MRSLVMSVALFTTAISSAIAQALIALSSDPLLVWNYSVFAVFAFVAGILFLWNFRQLDKDEERLNNLPTGKLHVESASDSDDVERNNNVNARTVESEKR